MVKQIGPYFYVRIILYVIILALSITSLASNKWGEISAVIGSSSVGKNSDMIPLNLNGSGYVNMKGNKTSPPSWINTVFYLMIVGTALQGVGFILNMADLSQKNDNFVLSGYALTFVGSVLVISAASEWMDQMKGFDKDYVDMVSAAVKAFDSKVDAKLIVKSTWAPPLALASGILGAASAIVGMVLEMHKRQMGKNSELSRSPYNDAMYDNYDNNEGESRSINDNPDRYGGELR